jgi:hypothetical protein
VNNMAADIKNNSSPGGRRASRDHGDHVRLPDASADLRKNCERYHTTPLPSNPNAKVAPQNRTRESNVQGLYWREFTQSPANSAAPRPRVASAQHCVQRSLTAFALWFTRAFAELLHVDLENFTDKFKLLYFHRLNELRGKRDRLPMALTLLSRHVPDAA